MEKSFTLQFLSEPVSSTSSIYIEAECSLLVSETGFSVLSFPMQNEFYAVANQGTGLYSQNVYQNQRVLRSSIDIEPVLTSCEECNAFEDLLFFKSYFCTLERFLPISSCPFAARFALKKALNSHEECNEFVDLLF